MIPQRLMSIKNGVRGTFNFNLKFLLFYFITSYSIAQNIDIAPLINLDELEPSYDEEFIELKNNESENNFILESDNYQNEQYAESFATISLLNKITAEVKTISINLKENYFYEDLRIYPIDCYNSKPLEKKETAVYLNIYNMSLDKKIFNGWMIKSLPSISSMEHPIYDLWVDSCYKL